MPSSLLFTIEVSARPMYLGDGNNERYTAQAMARNGEPLQFRGESRSLSDALQQLVELVKKQESTRGEARDEAKSHSLPLFSRLFRAFRMR